MQYTYRIKSRNQFNAHFSAPVIADDMPEHSAEETMLMKIMGNKKDIRIEWLVKDYPSSVVDELTGVNSIKTAQDQFNFLLNTFEPIGIYSKYEVELEGVVPVFKKVGHLSDMGLVQTPATPTQYTATAIIEVGTIIVEVQ